jgi:hypothetical protein
MEVPVLDTINETVTDATGKTGLDPKRPDVTAADDGAFSVDEGHAIIGKDKISRGGFYAAINRNEVPHIRLGQRILLPRHAFLRWLRGENL